MAQYSHMVKQTECLLKKENRRHSGRRLGERTLKPVAACCYTRTAVQHAPAHTPHAQRAMPVLQTAYYTLHHTPHRHRITGCRRRHNWHSETRARTRAWIQALTTCTPLYVRLYMRAHAHGRRHSHRRRHSNRFRHAHKAHGGMRTMVHVRTKTHSQRHTQPRPGARWPERRRARACLAGIAGALSHQARAVRSVSRVAPRALCVPCTESVCA